MERERVTSPLSPFLTYTNASRDEGVVVHEAEEEEEEVPTNPNAKRTSSTSRNTKTNKSASVSQAVEKVLYPYLP
jgi:hypothetical protein